MVVGVGAYAHLLAAIFFTFAYLTILKLSQTTTRLATIDLTQLRINDTTPVCLSLL